MTRRRFIAPRLVNADLHLAVVKYPASVFDAMVLLSEKVREAVADVYSDLYTKINNGESVDAINQSLMNSAADLWLGIRGSNLPSVDYLIADSAFSSIGNLLLSNVLPKDQLSKSSITASEVVYSAVDHILVKYTVNQLATALKESISYIETHKKPSKKASVIASVLFKFSALLSRQSAGIGWQKLPSDRAPRDTDAPLPVDKKPKAVTLPFKSDAIVGMSIKYLKGLMTSCPDKDMGCYPSELIALSKKSGPNLDSVDDSYIIGILSSKEPSLLVSNIKEELADVIPNGSVYDALQVAVEHGVIVNTVAVLQNAVSIGDLPSKSVSMYYPYYSGTDVDAVEELKYIGPASKEKETEYDEQRTVPITTRSPGVKEQLTGVKPVPPPEDTSVTKVIKKPSK